MAGDGLLLKGGLIFDGVSESVIRGKNILIRNGKIADLIDESQTVDSVDSIDLKGAFVSPGFIDCHMHMLLEEARDKEMSLSTTSPGGERLDTAQAAVAFLGVYNCRRMLKAGFTTVMDGGGNSFIECAMREAISKHYFPGPDLYIAGKQITTNKAHFVGFSYDPYGPYGMRKAVRDLMYHSVDFVKLQLSPPIRMIGRNSQACDFTVEETEAAIDEAHNYGVPVHAHLRGAEAIKRFLRADGDIVIHGTGMDDEGIELMLKKDRYLCPTLLSPTIHPQQELLDTKSSAVVDLLAKTAERHWAGIRKAYRAGVRMAFSTDAGTLGTLVGTNAREFLNLAEIGMSNAEALRTATSEAAKAIGHDDTIGYIRKGYRANLTILRGNALDDLRNTSEVLMTMKDGEFLYTAE